MKEGSFIDDDCIIKDEIFLGIRNLVICGKCLKLLKNPMMCKNCQKAFCKVCIDKEGKCTTDNCLSDEFVENTNAYPLLQLIKFKCSNCQEIVKYNDVEKHLKDGCQQKENEPTLTDCIKQKQRLKQLRPE